MKTYYHVTKIDNLSSILEQGLILQIGERSKEIGETIKRIYLFHSFDDMENALMNWLGECFDEEDELVILKICLPDTFPIHTDIDVNGDLFYESYTQKQIPAQYIENIYDELYNEIKNEEIDLD